MMNEMKEVRQTKKSKTSGESSWWSLAADLGVVAAQGIVFSLAGMAVQRLVGTPSSVKAPTLGQAEDVIHLPTRKAGNA